MRRLLGWVAAAIVLVLGGILAEAHYEIQSIDPPVPTRAELVAAAAPRADGPTRIRFVNTSSQAMPDGRQGAHPGFLIEWAGGRAFLIDVGMDRPQAAEFGEPMEWLGAEPALAHGSVGEQMGDDAARIAGVAFTHLHFDHTGGMRELCDAADRELPVFQTPWQFERTNYGTGMGADDVRESGCAVRRRLGNDDGAKHYAIPGFPGLHAIAAGGHTPGSTIYLARVGGKIWILSGDVTNTKPHLLEDLDKPLAYSLLIVPENRGRLGRAAPLAARARWRPRHRGHRLPRRHGAARGGHGSLSAVTGGSRSAAPPRLGWPLVAAPRQWRGPPSLPSMRVTAGLLVARELLGRRKGPAPRDHPADAVAADLAAGDRHGVFDDVLELASGEAGQSEAGDQIGVGRSAAQRAVVLGAQARSIHGAPPSSGS